MENLSIKNYKDYVIIGLGNFGKSLALNLAENQKKILAIDSDAHAVESVQGFVTNAVVADVTKKEVLHSLGVQNFDCAVVCIGENLAASMLATLSCKELGVKYVIAKAQSEQHKELLEKIGADLVVFPEVFMSKKLTTALTDPYVNELIKLTNNYRIVEIKCPTNWVEKTIERINVRKKYNINIIFIKRDGVIIEPFLDAVLEESDSLVIAGTPKNIDAIENKVKDEINMKEVLSDAISEE